MSKASALQVLFDKNVPYKMRRYLVGCHVRTAAEQGWGRLANGELLNAAENNGFHIMVTADQSIGYQQNLKGRKLALVVLSTNDLDLLEQYPEKLVAAVDAAREGSYEFVRYELPPKPKRPLPGLS